MRVSVITVVKDHASGLTKTHASLLEQTFVDWEMIVVVGLSTDGTLDIAKELKGNDSRVIVLEQKGTGIYGAMNQGLEVAGGEFTWFMNAGDRFASKFVLEHVLPEMSDQGIGLVIGAYQIDTGGTNLVFSYARGNISPINFAFNRRGGCHQAMMFRTDVLKTLRGFDDSYSLASDFDLVLKVLLRSRAMRVSEVYAAIEPGGLADQGIKIVHRQKHAIRRNLLGGPFIFSVSLIWTFLAQVKIAVREFMHR